MSVQLTFFVDELITTTLSTVYSFNRMTNPTFVEIHAFLNAFDLLYDARSYNYWLSQQENKLLFSLTLIFKSCVNQHHSLQHKMMNTCINKWKHFYFYFVRTGNVLTFWFRKSTTMTQTALCLMSLLVKRQLLIFAV